jgi:hypothetical protein
MGELITLIPNDEWVLVVDRSRDSYFASWSVNGDTVWQFETSSLDELKLFASNMLGQLDDTFRPLSGA